MEDQLTRGALLCLLAAALLSCETKKEHLADPLPKKDSLLFMRSKGVSTLISDSGIVRYRLIAEHWDVYNDTIASNPQTWVFPSGALLERLDSLRHVDMYATADTVYYREQYLWEMRGRVVIHTREGTLIQSEELFYDDRSHYMWSNLPTHLEEPDRELDGIAFRSDDRMTDYKVYTARGSFVNAGEPEPAPQETPVSVDTPRVAPSAPGKLEAEMRRRGRQQAG